MGDPVIDRYLLIFYQDAPDGDDTERITEEYVMVAELRRMNSSPEMYAEQRGYDLGADLARVIPCADDFVVDIPKDIQDKN